MDDVETSSFASSVDTGSGGVPVTSLNVLLGLVRPSSPTSDCGDSTHSSISLHGGRLSPSSETTDESFVDGIRVGSQHVSSSVGGAITLRARENRATKADKKEMKRQRLTAPRYLNPKGVTKHTGHRRQRRWLNGM
jgi:hypothetical protein